MSEKETLMSSRLEEHDACLPVTAIQALDLAGVQLVLSGVGHFILLIDESTGSLLDRLQIFERNTIHGFQPLFSGSHEARQFYTKFLVWGGQSLRIIEVNLQKSSNVNKISLFVVSQECPCPDWILDAHVQNHLRNHEVLLVEKVSVALITAHNTLLFAEVEDVHSKVDSIQVYEVDSRLKPILYSANIIWTSPTNVLVAAGTVFGEIIVWSCQVQIGGGNPICKPQIHVHHFFTGHEGSIFGVNISQPILVPGESEPRRFLASCSDDRTIRIWSILASSSRGDAANLSMDRNTRGTGFGTYIGELDVNQDTFLAKAWAHEARIWGVRFLETSLSEDPASLKVVSYSEDATYQLWNFNSNLALIEGEATPNPASHDHLTHTRTYRHHSGKHVWSLTVRENPATYTIYSGGADGNIFSMLVDRLGDHVYGEHRRLYTEDNIFSGSAIFQIDPLDPRKQLLKQKSKRSEYICKYVFVTDNCFVAASSDGKVLLGRVRDAQTASISWETLTTLEGVTSYSFLAGDPHRGLAVICSNKTGKLWLYDHANGNSIQYIGQMDNKLAGIFVLAVNSSNHSIPNCLSLFSFVVSFLDSSKVVLLQLERKDFSLMSRREFQLPSAFVVTSAGFAVGSSHLILGSRKGALAIYNVETSSAENSIQSLWCVPGVHGDETVTSISSLEFSGSSRRVPGYIITTGRDGYYCVHEILSSSDGSSSGSKLQTVHRSCPAMRMTIEGASVDSGGNLVLIGFRGTSFVAWNESTQSELIAVECGGGHRTWVYHSGKDGKFLLWRQAGALNLFSKTPASSYRALRLGGHGREVNTLAITPPIPLMAKKRKQAILATGSEDTCIRLFLLGDDEPNSQPYGKFRCIYTLRQFSSGLQHLQWSANSRFLFSSGGREEFYVWRVRYLPGFGMGVVNVGTYPKSKPDSDLRITHFEAIEVETEETNTDAFLIFTCYSNSVVRVFYLALNTQECSYTLLAEGRYLSNCLTYIRFVRSVLTPYLITAATDGRITVWNLASALGQFLVSTDKVKGKSTFKPPVSPSPLTWEGQYQIHQSSIKGMAFVAASETSSLIITGGDDNALAISTLSIPLSSTPSALLTAPLSLSDAHASAINEVIILREQIVRSEDNGRGKLEILAASSGNDQRVKIWLIRADLSGSGLDADSVEMSLKDNMHTAVADLSCMGTYTPTVAGEASQQLVLCGVGMEMWTLKQK